MAAIAILPKRRLGAAQAVISLGIGLALAGASGLNASAGGVSAEHHYTFEYWCEEVQRYEAERCSARRDEDVREYQRVRRAISRYELEYKDKCDRRDELKRDLECGDFFEPRRY